MTAVESPAPQPAVSDRALLTPWLIMAGGLLLLYLPTIYSLFNGLWSTDDQGHGPIVLAIASWLIYKRWPELQSRELAQPCPVWGWSFLVISGLAYALGRSQGIWIFEVGSAIGVLVGIVLLLRGARHVRMIGFALFFLFFMIPLPGAVVDAMTQPMKMAVSYVAEAVLYAAGYPISRTGVILQIGPYQLLVADACAGMHTLFTLEALGLLYLNMVKYASLARNITLAILIVPISFAANVIRVIVLTLVTFYLGDEAGQGFLHGFAGMVLFMSALMLIIGADTLIRIVVARVEKRRAA